MHRNPRNSNEVIDDDAAWEEENSLVETNRFSFKITAWFESVGVLVNQSMVPGVGVCFVFVWCSIH